LLRQVIRTIQDFITASFEKIAAAQSHGHSSFDKPPVPANFSSMKTTALLFVFSMMTNLALHAASLYDIQVKDIDGKPTTLSDYKGRVLLIVNVASKCGFTPQYAALEATYKKYADKGFVILGFPCNQFGGQEPGSDAEIKQFCTSKYDVTFPMFDKIEVNGPDRHPLYVQLAGESSPFPGNIGWNFTKFLIGKDGQILKRFDSKTKPDSPEVVAAIETALAAK
jgi:glutathione peroxidase